MIVLKARTQQEAQRPKIQANEVKVKVSVK